MLRLGIDIMGGDYAPRETTLGAIAAFNELPKDVKLVLIGDSNAIRPVLSEQNFPESNFEIIHTSEVIEMSEHPTKSFQQKPKSSLALGF